MRGMLITMGDGYINLLDPDSDNDGFLDGEEMNAALQSRQCSVYSHRTTALFPA